MSQSPLKMLGFKFYLLLLHLCRLQEIILEVNPWTHLLYKLYKKDKIYNFFSSLLKQIPHIHLWIYLVAASCWQWTIVSLLSWYFNLIFSLLNSPCSFWTTASKTGASAVPHLLPVIATAIASLPSATPQSYSCYFNDLDLLKRLFSCHLLYAHFLYNRLFFYLHISSYRSFVWCQ